MSDREHRLRDADLREMAASKSTGRWLRPLCEELLELRALHRDSVAEATTLTPAERDQ